MEHWVEDDQLLRAIQFLLETYNCKRVAAMLEVYRRQPCAAYFVGSVVAALLEVLLYMLEKPHFGTARALVLEALGVAAGKFSCQQYDCSLLHCSCTVPTYGMLRLKNIACAYDCKSAERIETLGLDEAYLWRSDILPRAPDAAGFNPPLCIDTTIPGTFNELLDIKDARKSAIEDMCTFGSSTYDVRRHHLYVPVAAETALKSSQGSKSPFCAIPEVGRERERERY